MYQNFVSHGPAILAAARVDATILQTFCREGIAEIIDVDVDECSYRCQATYSSSI